jgi:hypothetical protein
MRHSKPNWQNGDCCFGTGWITRRCTSRGKLEAERLCRSAGIKAELARWGVSSGTGWIKRRFPLAGQKLCQIGWR